MDAYRIILTPDAEEDMKELRSYIADVLSVQNTALAYVQAVRKEIRSLSEMPARYRPVDEEPWHSRGIRRLIVKNSYVYYRIDEAAKKVLILNVVYARRDQLKALSRISTD